MHIPIEALEPHTLLRVIEEFVTREGTDYGWQSSELKAKVELVLRQMKKGEALLFFDPESESCHIVAKSQAHLFTSEGTSAPS